MLTLLLTYVAVLEWGAPLGTPRGLVVQVIAQKIVAVLAVGAFVFLSLDAERSVTSAVAGASTGAGSISSERGDLIAR